MQEVILQTVRESRSPFFFLLISIGLVAAILVYKDAKRNSTQSAELWAAVALFFSLLGTALYFIAGRDKTRASYEDEVTLACKECGEEISHESSFCPGCGAELEEVQIVDEDQPNGSTHQQSYFLSVKNWGKLRKLTAVGSVAVILSLFFPYSDTVYTTGITSTLEWVFRGWFGFLGHISLIFPLFFWSGFYKIAIILSGFVVLGTTLVSPIIVIEGGMGYYLLNIGAVVAMVGAGISLKDGFVNRYSDLFLR